ncbi:MAG TPA: response regulator transcription factor [Candidatus Margulisiibacteriota bacterium]|nr:response regulator transcription factor [Candidatus Margulisiibacteriota bacterium]
MRLLIVEDEQTLARYLQRGLQEAAWTADVCPSVDEAWRLLLLNSYDLIVLDLGLPGADGSVLLRRVREAGMDMPVLILTARGAVEDRVAELNAGADDYVSKPFAFAELMARLHALLRRGRDRQPLMLKVDDLHLDVVRRQVQRGAQRIELTAREFSVLEFLMRHAGEVVTRTTLAEHVWGDHYDSLSNLIEVFINRLRKKIEPQGTPRLLHTVRGAGYVMRAADAGSRA